LNKLNKLFVSLQEHSFEVSLFAELFNEMLMRDFGFRIYKALVEAPEKPKEEKEDKVSVMKFMAILMVIILNK
jgi:hypothetical protein